jgi:hypothetical protein
MSVSSVARDGNSTSPDHAKEVGSSGFALANAIAKMEGYIQNTCETLEMTNSVPITKGTICISPGACLT